MEIHPLKLDESNFVNMRITRCEIVKNVHVFIWIERVISPFIFPKFFISILSFGVLEQTECQKSVPILIMANESWGECENAKLIKVCVLNCQYKCEYGQCRKSYSRNMKIHDTSVWNEQRLEKHLIYKNENMLFKNEKHYI